MSTTLGTKLKLTIFGESHGASIGGVIDGILPGVKLDMDYIEAVMKRRMPGQNDMSTPRKEADKAEILSGIFNGITTGAPIAFESRNSNQHSSDYEKTKNLMRPGHADYTGYMKYKGYSDYRGGGHFSGRLTAVLTFAGAIASYILEGANIFTTAHVLSIGEVVDENLNSMTGSAQLRDRLKQMELPVISEEKEILMRNLIQDAKANHDSIGGVVECAITGVPAGIGSPFFDSVESRLSHMLFSIPAVKGIEFGDGFEMSKARASMVNDEMSIIDGEVTHKSNHNGGILGGITNAMPIIFKTAIKPTPSIAMSQNTVDINNSSDAIIEIKGRHDPCIVPRVVPVIESVSAFVILDMMLDENPEYIKSRWSL